MVVAPCVVGVWWVRGVRCVWPRGERLVWKENRASKALSTRREAADVVEGILREPQQPNGISEVDDSIMSVLYLQRLCASTMGQS